MLTILPCSSATLAEWFALRQALWPNADADALKAELTAYLREPQRFGQWLAWRGTDAIGVAEASLRYEYVNGTATSPVLFLEGMYVKPGARRSGVAHALMHVVERWGAEHGCSEFASDASVDNEASRSWHHALGFEETERVVYFRKPLV